MSETIFASGDVKGPAIWRDKKGVVHQAVGAQMVAGDRGTFIMWTACGKKDIPANSAYISDTNAVNCPDCLSPSTSQEGA